MNCNKCGKHMKGSTAYDAVCSCGGLITEDNNTTMRNKNSFQNNKGVYITMNMNPNTIEQIMYRTKQGYYCLFEVSKDCYTSEEKLELVARDEDGNLIEYFGKLETL